ncbi:hypothetical protein B0O80DRAFT_490807 [Mortierella sp. GBAus27b]|nr:hypothetical protein BGX31_010504 [Mortierella sp. GBA43]KAI8346921.1 hypothetical protein B0O80DRAFT_490807 [Mortierella sp. GBAus27b]
MTSPQQKFRARHTSDPTHIPAQWDPDTNQHVIFWDDILKIFTNAKGVKKDGVAVLFLEDSKFAVLEPKRIPCYETSTLELVFAATNGLEDHAPPIVDATANSMIQRGMSEGFHLHSARFQNTVFMEQLNQMQAERNYNNRVIMGLQEQSLQLNQQTHNRMDLAQRSIRALITQTYELFENPGPRLLIVLPKLTRSRERISKPLPHHFRLYFLCECGDHTMQGKSSPHEVHLVEHDGYDIDRPNEFFELYGPYILEVMLMFKTGIAADGVVVPPLAGLKIDEGLDRTERLQECMRHIGPLVDDSIAFLQGLKHNNNGTTRTADGSMGSLKIPEGAEFSRLESYLRRKNESSVLGGLHRIVTPMGHVKWVCSTHRLSDHHEPARAKLLELVTMNHGNLDDKLGEIKVMLHSSQCAKEFYQALTAVQGIQKLYVDLSWDATIYDLRKLAEAVKTANIVDLTIVGGALLGRFPADLHHRSDRFDPLWQLGSNGIIQSLRFVLFRDIFYRLSPKAFMASQKLRVLKLHSPIDGESKLLENNLQNIITSFPKLAELGVRLQSQKSIIPVMNKILSDVRTLKSLEIYFAEFYTKAAVTQGKIQAIQLYLPFTYELDQEDPYHKSYTIPFSEVVVMEQVEAILKSHPSLTEITIGCRFESLHTLVKAIAKAKRDASNSKLRKVEIIRFPENQNDHPHKLSLDFADCVNCTNSTNRTNRADCTDCNNDLGCSFDISMMPRTGPFDPYFDIFHQHGCSIKSLDARNGFIDDKMAQILRKTTEGKRTRLRALTLNTMSISMESLKDMDGVIRGSKDLEHFVLDCQSLDSQEEQEKAQWLATEHGERLTVLNLHGHHTNQAIQWLAGTFRSRHLYPRLTDLQLAVPQDPFMYQHEVVPWLTQMVSAPSSGSTTASLSQPVDQEHTTSGTWSPLTRLSLQYYKFGRDDWTKVISAIDFSELEVLDLTHTNFAERQLEELICRVCEMERMAPLRTLDLSSSSISSGDLTELNAKLDRFLEKAPLATIKGLLLE